MNDLLAEEMLADESAQVAVDVECQGCLGEAEAPRVVTRNHRISMMDGRTRLVGLHDVYDHLLGLD